MSSERTSACTNSTPLPASTSSKGGATSQQATLPVASSYSIGRKTKRSERSTSVIRGLAPPQSSPLSRSAVYSPPKPPPSTHTSPRPRLSEEEDAIRTVERTTGRA